MLYRLGDSPANKLTGRTPCTIAQPAELAALHILEEIYGSEVDQVLFHPAHQLRDMEDLGNGA